VDVALVARREDGMTPYEVMLSESQERMLFVVSRGREAEVREVFETWDLEAAVIGEVTVDGRLEIVEGSSSVASLPVDLLTRGAPIRRLEGTPATPAVEVTVPETGDFADTLVRLLGSPNLCSRRPIFRQYDHMVGDATLVAPGGDAALIRIKGTRRALALTTDCNSRYCHLDPYLGAQIAVAEAARNIIATGAKPLAVTDCLNFGNPDRPDVFWQLEEAVAGIAQACRALELPVVSGNVSLYNESESGSIFPTPVIGMVGLLEDYDHRLQAGLRQEGDFVLLVGATRNDLGGSEYAKVVHGIVSGPPPALDLSREKAVDEFVLAAVEARLLRSAHDVAEGGMLVALAECCLLGGIGIRGPALKPEDGLRLDAALFGESQSRFIVSAASRSMPELQTLARKHRVEIQLLGLAGGDAIEFEDQLRLNLGELRHVWESGLVGSKPPPQSVGRSSGAAAGEGTP
jgi:phosphoribosylformylglycinamidine synthase